MTTDLKKFERRGNTARNRVQREVKRTRTRVERELRQRRNQATRLVKRNRREAERQVKAVRRDVERQVDDRPGDVETQIGKVQDQVTTKPGPSTTSPRPAGETGAGVGLPTCINSSAVAVSLLPQPAAPFGRRRFLFVPAMPIDSLCHNQAMPTEEQIRDALRSVIDPELRKDIVELGMVRSIEQPEDGRVHVRVSLTTPGCPIRSHFQDAVGRARGRARAA